MLWYKAWRETRVQFMLSGLILAAFCVFAVFSERYVQSGSSIPLPRYVHQGAHSEYIYDLIYSGTAKGLFTLLILFLGLSGLQRERSQRTAVFTLALPVSRRRVVGTQLAVGIAELAFLALLPAVLLPALSTLIQESFPFSEAFHFSVLWFAGGILIYSVSFLLTVATTGEYTGPVICYLLLMVHTIVAQWRPLRPYRLNLLWRLGEFQMMRWDTSHTLLLPPPLAWGALSAMTLISVALFAAAIRVTDRQDF